MKSTMTVKELIKELLEFDMDEPVFIGLGGEKRPDGNAAIKELGDYCAGGLPFEFGVYLMPKENIKDADERCELCKAADFDEVICCVNGCHEKRVA